MVRPGGTLLLKGLWGIPQLCRGLADDSAVALQTHSAQHSPQGPHLHPPHLQRPPGGEFGEGKDGRHPACTPPHLMLSWWQLRQGPCVGRSSQEPSTAPAPYLLLLLDAIGLGGPGDQEWVLVLGGRGEGMEEEEKIAGWLKHTKKKETKIQNQSIQTEINPKLW